MTRFFSNPNVIAHVVASNPDVGKTSLTALNPVGVRAASNPDGAVPCLSVAWNLSVVSSQRLGLGENSTSNNNPGLAFDVVVRIENEEFDWIQLQ